MMSRSSDQSATEQKVSQIVSIMQDVQFHADGDVDGGETVNDDSKWKDVLATLESLEDDSGSYAQINQKRKSLTFEAFRCPKITMKALAVESLMAPDVHHMHILFKRTEFISRAEFLPPAAASEKERCLHECLGLCKGRAFKQAGHGCVHAP